MISATSSGVLPSGSRLSFSMVLMTSGSLQTRATASDMRRMIERGAPGGAISVPAGHDKSRHGLCHCRSIGKLRDAFGVGQGQKPYVSAADAFNDVRDV